MSFHEDEVDLEIESGSEVERTCRCVEGLGQEGRRPRRGWRVGGQEVRVLRTALR